MASLSNDIAALVRSIIKKERGSHSQFVQGVFVSAETVDANLSQVTILGTTTRYVRKLSHVTGLTNGQAILMLQGGGIPLTIIGIVVGDPRKAE